MLRAGKKRVFRLVVE